MRILIVTTVAPTIRAFLLPYAAHFRARQCRVDGMAAGIRNCDLCRSNLDQTHEVPWSRRLRSNYRIFTILREVRLAIESNQYDIVHVHTPVAAFLTRLAISRIPARKRPRLIYTVHGFHFQEGNPWFENLIYREAERVASRWTDYLITINEMDTLAARRLNLLPPGCIEQMPGIGVDRRFFNPSAISAQSIASVRQQFGIPAQVPIFTMIAEFLPRKRHEDAIEAFSAMRNRDSRLVFVGAGPTISAMKSLAASATASERIHFAGECADVRPYILASRATVMPSSQEGMPRSILESLCCGVPVIGSDIRGIRDLLPTGGVTLFTCRNVQELAGRLDSFAWDESLACDSGSTARRRMGPFDIENVIDLHEQLYLRVLAGDVATSVA